MIRPSQLTVTIDLEGLSGPGGQPLTPAEQTAILNVTNEIDAQLSASWKHSEHHRIVSVSYTLVGGYAAWKEAGWRRLLEAYESEGWRTQELKRSGTAFRAGFYRR